jgi:hypothetical protein
MEGIFNVKDYGALGDGVNNDTIPAQMALEAAELYSQDRDSEAIVYFPEGQYALSISAGDLGELRTAYIFTIEQHKITFAGDGVGKTRLIFHTLDAETGEPLADPSDNWTIYKNGRDYFKIARGGMFTVGPVGGIQGNVPNNLTIRDLTVDGNANPLGNAAVGGQYLDFIIDGNRLYEKNGKNVSDLFGGRHKVLFSSNFGLPDGVDLNRFYYLVKVSSSSFQISDTPDGEPIEIVDGAGAGQFRIFNGDGWDMSHKGFALKGGGLDGINFVRTHWLNWRGEIIHSGGDTPRGINFLNSTFERSDASAISCAGMVTIDQCLIKNCYNGVENYSRKPWQGTIITNTIFDNDSEIYPSANNAVVFIGLPDASLRVENNSFSGFKRGILISESAFNVSLVRNVFEGLKGTPVHFSALGLYPADADFKGLMANWKINKNKFVKSSEEPIYMQGVRGMENIEISENNFLANADGRRWRFLLRRFISNLSGSYQNMKIFGNVIEAEAGDFPNDSAKRFEWEGNFPDPKLKKGQFWPYYDNIYDSQAEGAVRTLKASASPLPIVVANHLSSSRNTTKYYTVVVDSEPVAASAFPEGFIFSILSKGSGHVRILPDGWASFEEPIILDPKNKDGTTFTNHYAWFRMGVNGVFDSIGITDENNPNPPTIEEPAAPVTIIGDDYSVSALVNRPFSVLYEAEGGVKPINWSITGAPEWLKIDNGMVFYDGSLSNKKDTGTYNIEVVASDQNGNADSKSLTVNIFNRTKFRRSKRGSRLLH